MFSYVTYFAASIAVGKARFGSFYGPIILDNLLCSGTEENLSVCNFGVGTHECDHNEDAGVICMYSAHCEEDSLRLVPSHLSAHNLYLTEGELDDFYFISDQIHRGRVEVCLDGNWGSVCYNEQWNNDEATVACRQLGFSPFGECLHKQFFEIF